MRVDGETCIDERDEDRHHVADVDRLSMIPLSSITADLFVVLHPSVSPVRYSTPIGVHPKLDPVGKLLAVLPNKGSLHCVLQVLADVRPDCDTVGGSFLVKAWTCQN